MRRSEVNAALHAAADGFARVGWALPPSPRWDVTDFGLDDFPRFGLVAINLAEEDEYCEKVFYATRGQIVPAHTHRRKKEDIIVRHGAMAVQVWPSNPDAPGDSSAGSVDVAINGQPRTLVGGATIELAAGERITLVPGVWHAFWPTSADAVLGEVSTKNDDLHDNFFADERVGRFSPIVEDAPVTIRLISEPTAGPGD